jgi:hypothetical protein
MTSSTTAWITKAHITSNNKQHNSNDDKQHGTCPQLSKVVKLSGQCNCMQGEGSGCWRIAAHPAHSQQTQHSGLRMWLGTRAEKAVQYVHTCSSCIQAGQPHACRIAQHACCSASRCTTEMSPSPSAPPRAHEVASNPLFSLRYCACLHQL